MTRDFFIEYFFSEDETLLKKLKEDLRAVTDRMVSALTIMKFIASSWTGKAEKLQT